MLCPKYQCKESDKNFRVFLLENDFIPIDSLLAKTKTKTSVRVQKYLSLHTHTLDLCQSDIGNIANFQISFN